MEERGTSSEKSWIVVGMLPLRSTGGREYGWEVTKGEITSSSGIVAEERFPGIVYATDVIALPINWTPGPDEVIPSMGIPPTQPDICRVGDMTGEKDPGDAKL
jgi:hypothetical protein